MLTPLYAVLLVLVKATGHISQFTTGLKVWHRGQASSRTQTGLLSMFILTWHSMGARTLRRLLLMMGVVNPVVSGPVKHVAGDQI
jgi:hypothetical protein